jgi:hypothetical protein
VAGLIVASAATARADTTTTSVAPVITSADFVQVELREPVHFTVTATGTPTPALTERGQLPAGITFTDNGNGTATIASDGRDYQDGGRDGNSYRLDITATSSAGTVTQEFTLHITQNRSHRR